MHRQIRQGNSDKFTVLGARAEDENAPWDDPHALSESSCDRGDVLTVARRQPPPSRQPFNAAETTALAASWTSSRCSAPLKDSA